MGATLARFFAAQTIPVLIASWGGLETRGELTTELGANVKAVTVDEAVEADIILAAVGSVAFRDVGAVLQDWSGKIVIDVTNGFMLPPVVQQVEYEGWLTSEVDAERFGTYSWSRSSINGRYDPRRPTARRCRSKSGVHLGRQ
jgi:predicted dinucleotide-binding enzyme